MSDERVSLARAELAGLCDGSRKFTMRVPADCERDSDMLISAGLDAADEAMAAADALRLSLAQAQADVAKLREALTAWRDADHEGNHPSDDGSAWDGLCEAARSLTSAALATPADDGALREMLRAAWTCGYDAPDANPYAAGAKLEEDIARVLGGAA